VFYWFVNRVVIDIRWMLVKTLKLKDTIKPIYQLQCQE